MIENIHFCAKIISIYDISNPCSHKPFILHVIIIYNNYFLGAILAVDDELVQVECYVLNDRALVRF